jgi:hypothetical protein
MVIKEMPILYRICLQVNLLSKMIFKMKRVLIFLWVSFVFFPLNFVQSQKINPFERPGSRQAKSPVIISPAPPPPAPKAMNPNIELRGIFKYRNEWHFSLFDRGTNKGAWLKIGESFDEGKVEIQGYNPESDELKLKGGLSLTLKNSTKGVLPVPSGLPVKKLPSASNILSPPRPVSPGNRPRAITIPPRVNLPPRK